MPPSIPARPVRRRDADPRDSMLSSCGAPGDGDCKQMRAFYLFEYGTSVLIRCRRVCRTAQTSPATASSSSFLAWKRRMLTDSRLDGRRQPRCTNVGAQPRSLCRDFTRSSRRNRGRTAETAPDLAGQHGTPSLTSPSRPATSGHASIGGPNGGGRHPGQAPQSGEATAIPEKNPNVSRTPPAASGVFRSDSATGCHLPLRLHAAPAHFRPGEANAQTSAGGGRWQQAGGRRVGWWWWRWWVVTWVLNGGPGLTPLMRIAAASA